MAITNTINPYNIYYHYLFDINYNKITKIYIYNSMKHNIILRKFNSVSVVFLHNDSAKYFAPSAEISLAPINIYI